MPLPVDFPSEKNPLIPRHSLLFQESCPLATGGLPHRPARLIYDH